MFELSSMSPVYVLEVPGQNPFSPRKKLRGEKDSRQREWQRSRGNNSSELCSSV